MKRPDPVKRFDAKTVRRLMRYIVAHNKGIFILSFACILLSTIADIGGSIFMQILVDDYIAPLLLETNPVFSGLIRVLCVMAAVYLIGVVCTFVYTRTMAYVAQNCLKTIRDDMFCHMQTLPIRYFDTHTHGEVMSHYTNDTDTLRQFISQALPQLFASVITIVGSFAVMLYYSWILSLVVVAVTVVILLITNHISAGSTRYFMRQQTALANVDGYIEEMFNGQKVVKVFCHEERAKQDFERKNNVLFEDARKANRYANVLMPILNQIGNIQYVLLALVGGAMAISGYGGITAGVVVAFLSLSKSFSMPFQQISQQVSMIAIALAGADRIFRLMDEQSETDDGTVTLVRGRRHADGTIVEDEQGALYVWKVPQQDGSFAYVELNGDIRMQDVDFGYTQDKIVLHQVSLYAHAGQKVAFVGATGAGKTTITNLLNRFYDIAQGEILYDGIPIRNIQKPHLRRSLGIVLQDTYLFTGTVMDNIRYGKPDASDEACIEAAKLANADQFIRNLPDGYQTVLTGAGAGLSQGQRQLLAIARAAVADPPVMILDEATSSIDTRTERLVQQGMDRLMAGRTTFVIAHRLSTIQNSDVIMVLDHGRIIERGNHDSLIEKRGTYYQLYTGAFELE